MLLNEFGESKTLSVCKSVIYPCNFLLVFFVFIIHNRQSERYREYIFVCVGAMKD